MAADAPTVEEASERAGGTEARAKEDSDARDPGTAAEESRKASALARSLLGVEVWFVGGFMSQLYDALSSQLEDEINDAIDDAARSLNVELDLPGGRELDLGLGDAIADALPRIDLPIEEGRFMSFYSQMRALDELGIPYRNVSLVSPAFDTSQSVEHNAAVIRSLLRSTQRKVLFVTHSKGGLDTLHALLGTPKLWGERVVGWVAFQSPFYGSPLADSSFPPISGMLLAALGGNGQAVEDLTTRTRTRYMQRRKSDIKRLTRKVPIIAAYSNYESTTTVEGFARAFAQGVFSTELVRDISESVSSNYAASPTNLPRAFRTSVVDAVSLIRMRVADASSAALGTIGLMTLPNAYLRDIAGVPNDGLVPQGSTALPGATHRELPAGDHASPVMDVDPFQNYWRTQQRDEVTLDLIEKVRLLGASPRYRPRK